MIRKRITQFRYFGDGKNKTAYEPVPSDKETDGYISSQAGFISEQKYNEMVKDHELYIVVRNEKKNIDEYRLLDETTPYDENTIYYMAKGKFNNYPQEISKTKLMSGSIFNNFFPITKIGIQAMPGTKFRINANLEWIIIGATGLYELDLANSSASIISLSFEETSLNNIINNDNAYLIIDIVYEQEE